MSTLSTEKCRSYLKKVLDLEIELYQLKRLRASIKNQINNIQNFLNKSEPDPPPSSGVSWDYFIWVPLLSGFFGASIGLTIWSLRVLVFLLGKYSLLFFIGFLFTSFSEIREAAGTISGHVIPLGILGLVIGFVIAIFPSVSFRMNRKSLEQEYSQKEAKRQSILAAQKKRLAATNQLYQKCNDSIRQTEQILTQYYALDILHKNYRGLVPVATIYEYFEAGLCTELKGHEGAYLIYKHQLQANIIAGKLDQIIERMDKIIDNQKLLAESIQSSNKMIDNMSRSMQKVVENQSVNQYYNRINAQNTQFLADYTFFKEIAE